MTSALRVANDGWEEVRRSVFTQQQLGAPLTRLPDVSPEEAARRSAVAKGLLALPHDP